MSRSPGVHAWAPAPNPVSSATSAVVVAVPFWCRLSVQADSGRAAIASSSVRQGLPANLWTRAHPRGNPPKLRRHPVRYLQLAHNEWDASLPGRASR